MRVYVGLDVSLTRYVTPEEAWAEGGLGRTPCMAQATAAGPGIVSGAGGFQRSAECVLYP